MTNDREELLRWAMQAGPSTHRAFQFRLKTNSAGGGILFCIAVRKLANKYGTEKVEEACEWLQQNGGHPGSQIIRKYIESKDRICVEIPDDFAKELHATEGITRGSSHYLGVIETQTKEGSDNNGVV